MIVWIEAEVLDCTHPGARSRASTTEAQRRGSDSCVIPDSRIRLIEPLSDLSHQSDWVSALRAP